MQDGSARLELWGARVVCTPTDPPPPRHEPEGAGIELLGKSRQAYYVGVNFERARLSGSSGHGLWLCDDESSTMHINLAPGKCFALRHGREDEFRRRTRHLQDLLTVASECPWSGEPWVFELSGGVKFSSSGLLHINFAGSFNRLINWVDLWKRQTTDERNIAADLNPENGLASFYHFSVLNRPVADGEPGWRRVGSSNDECGCVRRAVQPVV